MSAAAMLREYGLLGCMDSLANMNGEQLAVINALVPSIPEEGEEEEEEEGEEPSLEARGVTFFELQQNSVFLSNQLYMRLGVRPGDKVLLAGYGSTSAELTAMLACMRLQAVFVPVSVQFQSSSPSELTPAFASLLATIVADCAPVATILVGANDEDPLVRWLAAHGLYRYSLIDRSGAIVEEDPSAFYSSFQPPGASPSDVDPDGNPDHDHDHDTGEASASAAGAAASDALYVLYTSGSTGRPKGVVGSHRALINRLEYQYAAFPYAFNEIAVRRTPLSFVDAMVEVFAPALMGVPICGHLVDRLNGEGVQAIAADCGLLGITRLTLIPSQLAQWCSQLSREAALRRAAAEAAGAAGAAGATEAVVEAEDPWASVSHVFVSGEECPRAVVDAFRACLPRAMLVNLFGSTEVTGDVTASVLYDGRGVVTAAPSLNPLLTAADADDAAQAAAVPIGRAIGGNFLFLVRPDGDGDSSGDGAGDGGGDGDSSGDGAGDGGGGGVSVADVLPLDAAEGELLVVGEHVALGYHRPDDRLRHRFVANPFHCAAAADESVVPPAMLAALRSYAAVRGYATDAPPTTRSVFDADDADGDDDEADDAAAAAAPWDEAARVRALWRRLQAHRTAFRTGDLATFRRYDDAAAGGGGDADVDGEWQWRGRRDRVVKRFGQKLALDAVEAAVAALLATFLVTDAAPADGVVVVSLPTPAAAAAVEVEHSVVAVVVCEALLTAAGRCIGDFAAAVRQAPQLSGVAQPTLVLAWPGEAFPRTGSFKVDRARIVRDLAPLLAHRSAAAEAAAAPAAATAATAATATVEDVAAAVGDMMRRVLRYDATDDDAAQATSFAAMGGDSVAAIEVLWQLRQRFPGAALPPAQLLHAPVATLAAQLHAQLQPPPPPPRAATTAATGDDGDGDDGDGDEAAPAAKRVRRDVATAAYRLRDADAGANAATLPPAAWRAVQSRGRQNVDGGCVAALLAAPALRLTPRWAHALRKCIDASPTLLLPPSSSSSSLAAAAVVVGCHGGDVALVDAATGRPRWHAALQSTRSGTDHVEGAVAVDATRQLALVASFVGNDVHSAAPAAAATDGDDDGNCDTAPRGRVWAIDVATGALRWTQPLGGECKAAPLALAAEGLVVVGDYDGGVTVLHTATGATLGRLAPADRCDGAVYATPQLLARAAGRVEVLVATTRGRLYGVAIATGDGAATATATVAVTVTVAWRWAAEATCVFATPAIVRPHDDDDADGSDGGSDGGAVTWTDIVVAATDGSLRCLTRGDGGGDGGELRVRWQRDEASRRGAPFFASPVALPALGLAVLGGHDGVVRCVALATGDECAAIDLRSVVFATPAVALDAAAAAALVVAATTAGALHVLRLRRVGDGDGGGDGGGGWVFEPRATATLAAEVFSSPVLVAADGDGDGDGGEGRRLRVAVGCRDDRLHLFDLRPCGV